MTIRIFRVIILLYVVSRISGFIACFAVRHSLPPELDAFKYHQLHSHSFHILGFLAIMLMIAKIFNLITLYQLRSFARVHFLVLVMLLIAFNLCCRIYIAQPVEILFDELSNILQGVILAILYWSPIAVHFEREDRP